MIVALPFPATLADLMKVEGKAELIGGRIVEHMASGRLPNRIAKRIVRALDDYTARSGVGEAFPDNLGYALDPPLLSGRQSFSPDASYFIGVFPANEMAFVDGPPTFAAEVRSENDYGRSAEKVMAEKRADYFEAGTLAVWDVDPVAKTITLHTTDSEIGFGNGGLAHAEPALPGWTLDIAGLFSS